VAAHPYPNPNPNPNSNPNANSNPAFFWWEPIYIFQRLIIVGWVQFIPREAEFGRLLIGTTLSILWLSILLTQKPYKRDDINHFSSILQVLLVLLFTASQSVYLFRKLEVYYESESTFRILGFRSLDEIVAMMITFNLLVLAAFLGMLVYQTMTHRVVDSFRLVSNRQPPELTLARRMHCNWPPLELGTHTFCRFADPVFASCSVRPRFLISHLEQCSRPSRGHKTPAAVARAGHLGLP